tara:strand:+ start:36 stop:1025 length:990 start_codon:yes stop_codon:yes gene_type:complete
MSTVKPAKTYPDTIFKQTTPDETQELTQFPRFQTWYKGFLTKSEIYERLMPDGLTSALRIDGPDSGGAGIVMNHKGNIKLITGKRTDVAGSGTLDIRTAGCNQLHDGRTNIQYNAGGTENEKQALNVLCYGDVVEQLIGGTKHIIATKVEITASEELVLNGQTIKLQATGDIEMAAASFTTAQVNKKDIIIGQNMKFGAGEDTDLQFDPRSSRNVVSTGNINHKVLGDYKVKSLRRMEFNGVTGLFMSSPATTTVQGLAGMIVSGPGGLNLNAAKTTFETADFNVVSAKTDFKTADFNLDAAKLDLTGSADVSITGANVKITGALIYLN